MALSVGSRCQQDLAHGAAIVDRGERRHDVLEVAHLADDRVDRTRLEQRNEVVPLPTQEGRPGAAAPDSRCSAMITIPRTAPACAITCT